MRVLLTRAAEDAARTRERLEALGHEVIAAPVIEIVPLPARWPDHAVEAVVATSAHAFTSLPDGWGPAPEARRAMPLWLVGRRTHEAACARGFDGPAQVAPQAEALAARIAAADPAGRIAYLAGLDRKPEVERAMRAAGLSFETIETYEAHEREGFVAQVLAASRDGGPAEAVLHYSRRSAALYVGLMKKAGLSMKPARHVCLSKDVAEPLLGEDCDVVVAPEPTERALLDALDRRA